MSEEFNREESFGWLVNAMAHHMSKSLDAQLRKHGLSVALWPTLMCLWEQEGVTQREIAKKSKVESSTTTRTLDKLEKLGLVQRQVDPNSRRSFRIYLTDKGRALQKEITPIPQSVNHHILSALCSSEQKEMIRLLQKLVANIE
ncbi:MarR family transcriptional regulator [Vibrio zhanjiangensis]|uniref:MarR family transcriptional regulator n=1 Tax=Vibrio zhanjiangensis TaxID=1046128 RepID=A0ABQ6F1K8_9VIBR|nr:MarR family transcriptional regulator [Vibrio zhanjiangensis]GLT19124.1 MarR family transcriptional regulator [Vibrio zhanjiangensis]